MHTNQKWIYSVHFEWSSEILSLAKSLIFAFQKNSLKRFIVWLLLFASLLPFNTLSNRVYRKSSLFYEITLSDLDFLMVKKPIIHHSTLKHSIAECQYKNKVLQMMNFCFVKKRHKIEINQIFLFFSCSNGLILFIVMNMIFF